MSVTTRITSLFALVLLLAVTGCAAQVEPARFADMPEVDHVIGNAEKMRPDSWRRIADPGAGGEDGAPRVAVADIMALKETGHHLIESFGTRARAHVQIQNGCDHRCTFCIIPYGRGPSRSVPAANVIAQVRRLVEGGTREIVLTGVDITSWGADLGSDEHLGDLVRAILRAVPELERLRLSSIDSVEADAALLRALAEEERLMPHLHLSLQAGDDMILKRMKRRHLRADATAFCSEARRLRPDVVFGADLIAGFPTETEEMFANSERLIDDCSLTYLHVFPFSPRPGTPAARMPAVDRETVKARAARLRAAGQVALDGFLAGQVGRETQILVEKAGLGRTPQFTEVTVPSGAAAESAMLKVRVSGRDGNRLTGEVAA